MTGGTPNHASPQAGVDEFASGVIPPIPSEPVTERDFEPWHKPRKQIVRISWRENVRRLMGDRALPVGTPKTLRYFTLPGPEMMDIRTLQEAALDKGFSVQYIGLTDTRSGSEDDLQLQRGTVSLRAQKDWIHDSSTILYYKLEELVAGDAPVARRKLSDYGPFDVVNLDLCDYILAPGIKGRLIDALEQILKIQTTRPHGQDWLLFVATRFDPAVTCSERFERIKNVIASNCATSAEFKTGLEELLQASLDKPSEFLENPSQLSQAHLRDVLTIGLTKWIGNMLLQANPPFSLKLGRAFTYAVDGGKEDMLSLVYRCVYSGNPVPIQGQGVAPIDVPSAEIEIAKAALAKTKTIVNIDTQLAGNQIEWAEMARQTKDLLQRANYSDHDLKRYDEWAVNKAAAVQA